MTQRNFNGTTVTFGGVNNTKVYGLTFRDTRNKIDVTEPSDARKMFELGLSELAISGKVRGANPWTTGNTGSLSLGWADGEATNSTSNWSLASAEKSGTWDGMPEWSVEWCPAP